MRKFSNDFLFSFYDDPELFHWGVDHVYRRCVLEKEKRSILNLCNSYFLWRALHP